MFYLLQIYEVEEEMRELLHDQDKNKKATEEKVKRLNKAISDLIWFVVENYNKYKIYNENEVIYCMLFLQRFQVQKLNRDICHLLSDLLHRISLLETKLYNILQSEKLWRIYLLLNKDIGYTSVWFVMENLWRVKLCYVRFVIITRIVNISLYLQELINKHQIIRYLI